MNNEVLFQEINHLGLMTLNRPNVLNAINHSMIVAMYAQLIKWAQADHIKAVLICAADGRAFCAGGDLRSTYARYLEQGTDLPYFFRDEYRLNRTIFHYPKPYIALLDGITMGGGVGISIHGSHRVATERLVFAMPETSIGFFPDVGGSYFLPRLPNKIGFYLGLTGTRLACDDCITLGIAQYKVKREALFEIIQVLSHTAFENDPYETVTNILDQFKEPAEKSQLSTHQSAVHRCFSHDTIESILAALKNSSDALCQEISKILKTKSPTSLKITLRELQEGMKLDFDACMQLEYRLANRFLQGHDFFEGIRAIIIDKDQTPHWQPNTLADVTHLDVAKYFAPLDEELELDKSA